MSRVLVRQIRKSEAICRVDAETHEMDRRTSCSRSADVSKYDGVSEVFRHLAFNKRHAAQHALQLLAVSSGSWPLHPFLRISQGEEFYPSVICRTDCRNAI